MNSYEKPMNYFTCTNSWTLRNEQYNHVFQKIYYIGYCNIIAPIFNRIVNQSLSSSIFPSEFKSAVEKPLLKKITLDSADLKIAIPYPISLFFIN